ncbi:MAG: glycosyl hydrolase [Thermoanaerobaculia bacterium]
MKKLALLLVAVALPALAAETPKDAKKSAKKEEPKSPLSSATFSELKFRSIGPALTSGRISDLAVNPRDPAEIWVAAASGGVWKTTNAGVTWASVFDGQPSFSIGCLAIDAKNPNVVWVGTGENNSQRSVSWGDGVYLTEDGGKNWRRVGLEKSEHIGKILIDPRDSRIVYVAAQGPLWGPGGDRGLYKTLDLGKTWKKVLEISDNTGVSDIAFDPRDPDLLYAVAYQRRRHVWTLVDGGPESTIYKSSDGGASWKKAEKGLPAVDKGRIGIAVSPADPDTVYAIVEAEGDAGGFFRSTDRGESWEKRGPHVSGSPQYYQEIFADPFERDRIYSMDTLLQVSIDGGKTFKPLGEKSKHVDNHVIWVDPRDAEHYLVGCDGGLYESFDRGENWRYFGNLPITQFYRVALDQASPVYNVYGGTQDNNSLGGPSRTLANQGPANEDWFITQGGDGFFSQIDPQDPNLVYAEAQYGALTRFDRKSGENVEIQPQPAPGEPPLRWNWDSPLLLSPHSHTRIYFAANRLFRSDDRGDSWRAVSPDLTRQLDRNQLKVFGKIQRIDAVAKNASTSFYGNIVALDESSRVEGLLYVGTDDGLIQVSEDGGANWRKSEAFPGVPERTFVSRLAASRHDDQVVYAAFDNHKNADFKPYLLRSPDRGRTWTSIAGDLPAGGPVYALAEDPQRPELLFAGTEYGLFFTVDGGKKWVQLKGGLPPIAVRDIAIQKRESDLVLATFGRGFYVLDDYSPLRAIDAKALDQTALTFPVKRAWLYLPGSRIGDRGKGFQGESWYLGENPPFGAVLTYYLKEGFESAKDKRQKAEKEAIEAGKDPAIPAWEELRAETHEEEAKVIATVRDADGRVVRRLEGPASEGLHRLVWDLRYPAADPLRATPPASPFYVPPVGQLAGPGRFTAQFERRENGKSVALGEQTFAVESLARATLPAADRGAVESFESKVARLQRAVLGAERLVDETKDRIDQLRKTVPSAPALEPSTSDDLRALGLALEKISIALSGDSFLRDRQENTPPAISERVQNVVASVWFASAAPTQTQRDAYRWAGEAFTGELAKLRQLVQVDLPAIEKRMEDAGAPWTPGRVPEWTME